jgi:hypothetical protein
LNRAGLQKCALEGGTNAIALETFDRQYVLLGTIGRKTQTRANGHTVETNSASTANTLITTSFGPC